VTAIVSLVNTRRSRAVVLVEQLVPKLVGRIQPLLQCKEFGRPWLGTSELLLSRVKLIRQIV